MGSHLTCEPGVQFCGCCCIVVAALKKKKKIDLKVQEIS